MMVQGICAGCNARYRRYGVDEWLTREEDSYCTDDCHDKSVKPKDRTGLVQINKDGIITGWKFDEGE
jgi:hypothetical protein